MATGHWADLYIKKDRISNLSKVECEDKKVVCELVQFSDDNNFIVGADDFDEAMQYGIERE